MPFIIDVVIFLGLFLSPFVLKKQQTPKKEQKQLYWMQVILFIIVSATIFVLLYLQFTPVGTPSQIEGVQSRYFVPFIALLIMIPYKFILSNNWRKFAYTAPFVGVAFYLGFIVAQLI